MSIPALHAKLVAEATITAIVPATRIKAGQLDPNDTRPAITIENVSDEQVQCLSNAIPLRSPMHQVTCWADTYAGAHDLADVVRAAIHHYTGGTLASVGVCSITVLDGRDTFVPPREGQSKGSYGKSLDLRVWHRV